MTLQTKKINFFVILRINAIMNLVVDIGNTNLKYFLFSKGSIIESCIKDIISDEKFLKEIKNNFSSINNIIYSDVRNNEDLNFSKYFPNSQIIKCSSKLILPFKSNYKPLNKLGEDRISLLSSKCLNYPQKHVLIIDIGTCITYDFIDNKNIHHGGSISPGFESRYKTISESTKKLPLLKHKIPKNIIGNSTEKSIHSGIYYGVLSEIKYQIKFYTKQYKNINVVLTGGDSIFLSKPLKNRIFADQNFLAQGLNYLLELNKN